MQSDLTFSPLAWIFLIIVILLFCQLWCSGKLTSAAPKPPGSKREPQPFAGLTHKPDCDLCYQQVRSQPPTPSAPPPRMSFTRGRRRQVDTSGHFCPQASGSYHGGVDWGNIRANGYPNGRRWRQLVCLSCHGYFLETVGTPFQGKQVEPDKLVWAIAALTEGLGLRPWPASSRSIRTRFWAGWGRRPNTSRPSVAIACAR